MTQQGSKTMTSTDRQRLVDALQDMRQKLEDVGSELRTAARRGHAGDLLLYREMSRRLSDLSSRFQGLVKSGSDSQDAAFRATEREIEELTTTWLHDIARLKELAAIR